MIQAWMDRTGIKRSPLSLSLCVVDMEMRGGCSNISQLFPFSGQSESVHIVEAHTGDSFCMAGIRTSAGPSIASAATQEMWLPVLGNQRTSSCVALGARALAGSSKLLGAGTVEASTAHIVGRDGVRIVVPSQFTEGRELG